MRSYPGRRAFFSLASYRQPVEEGLPSGCKMEGTAIGKEEARFTMKDELYDHIQPMQSTKQQQARQILWRVVQCFGPYQWSTFLVFGLILLTSLLGLVNPLMIRL